MPFSQRDELGVQLLNNAFNGNCRRRGATSNLARPLGTVAVAKHPGNLRGSLFKPPEVGTSSRVTWPQMFFLSPQSPFAGPDLFHSRLDGTSIAEVVS